MRKITVLKKAESRKWYSFNHVQVEIDGQTWTADWPTAKLEIELLQDKLIAAGADPDTVKEFRESIRADAYSQGSMDATESESI